MTHYPVEIGSQLFINRYDTPAQIKHWVRQMSESHFKLIRLFITWEHIEPQQGHWDFSQYDACFEEAEAQGMRVVPTLSANGTPAWAHLVLGIREPHDLNQKAVWDLGLAYVKKVVTHYAQSPALDSWILWNEPGYPPTRSDASLKAYGKFLKKYYANDLDALNKVYRGRYLTFKEAARDQSQATDVSAFVPYTEHLDWMRFCVHNLMDRLSDIKDEVKKIDPLHRVHVNPHNVSQSILPSGQSIWAEAKVVDFLGCSVHPSWHSTRFPQDRLHQSVALFADLMKSATPHPDGLFWVTEMQGGTNIFSGVTYLCPNPAELRSWMWEAIGAGAKAVVFWCFNARDSGFEAGEWGLLDQKGRPSQRLQAAADVANILEQNQALFASARPPAPDVWILHSENTGALGLIEGSSNDIHNPRTRQMGSDALCGAYLLCADLGLTIQMIDEEQLVEKGLPENSTLILPGITSLETSTCQAIADLVDHGCTLIADGLCGYKDKNGNISFDNQAILEKVFAVEVEDIQASGSDFDIWLNNGVGSFSGWFIRCIFAGAVPENVLARFTDETPAVVQNRFGSGRAVRIGTTFFQRYFGKPEQAHLDLLQTLLADMPSAPAVLENGSYQLRLKRLCAADNDILILINTGEAASASLRFDHAGSLIGLNQPTALAFAATSSLAVEVPSHTVLIFKTTR